MSALPTPSLDEIVTRPGEDGWDVPVEVAVFCTSSAFKAVIRSRYPGGNVPKRTARMFMRGGRFFAVVFFPHSNDLLIPLDVHPFENREAKS